LPPKPQHLVKNAKPASRILEGLLKVDPEVRQVMLDMELEKLESEIKGLRRGIEIYSNMTKVDRDEENPECKRMKVSLAEKVQEFHALCEYREKFGMGKYPLKDIIYQGKNHPFVTNEVIEKNKSEKLLPKQAWPDKDIPPISPLDAAVNLPSGKRISVQGFVSGESRDDDVFPAISRPPPIIPLDSLGSFQPISIQNVPKPDELKKRVLEKPHSKWECQFCTYYNESGTSRCSVCENENINPKYVDHVQDVDTAIKKFREMTVSDRPLVS
jgi:hypothetical protein